MATVISSSFRYRRNLLNLTHFGRCYSTSNTNTRYLNHCVKYLCIFSGGLFAFSYGKWAKYDTVHAFNPKKIKVSYIKIQYLIYTQIQFECNAKYEEAAKVACICTLKLPCLCARICVSMIMCVCISSVGGFTKQSLVCAKWNASINECYVNDIR